MFERGCAHKQCYCFQDERPQMHVGGRHMLRFALLSPRRDKVDETSFYQNSVERVFLSPQTSDTECVNICEGTVL